MMKLRPYQQDALTALDRYWRTGGKNPLIEMATGTGKSMVIAKLCQDLLEQYPTMRILMLTHVKELVAQNFQTLIRVWPSAQAGIYSAGLNRRDAHQRIVFASIQSVFKRAKLLGQRDLIMIDEAHLVPKSGAGMYQKLLDDIYLLNPDARVVGFTATPYRLDSGRLDEGEYKLFDKIIYTYDIAKGIDDGYLSPLMSKASAVEIDVSNVERRGGEFVPASLEIASDTITQEAVGEIINFGEARKCWLIFCAGVDHAFHVRDALRGCGISCETVTGNTPNGERDSIIRRFRNGEIRALTNANVLTTGFDVPHVDMVVMLRPTLSTSLYVQIVGRGTRLSNNKDNCLILDFAGNIRRHGPVDAISVLPKKAKKGEGKVNVDDVRAKTCPSCNELVALNTSCCKWCGHEWPRDDTPKHEAHADGEVGILSSEKVPPQVLPVVKWFLNLHEKLGSPDSLRVTYYAGLSEYREWIAFEHGGYAGQKAQQWWMNNGGQTPFPKTTAEALARQNELIMPQTITVKPNGKFFNIVGRSSLPKLEAAQ